jgi:hypothetical protein
MKPGKADWSHWMTAMLESISLFAVVESTMNGVPEMG